MYHIIQSLSKNWLFYNLLHSAISIVFLFTIPRRSAQFCVGRFVLEKSRVRVYNSFSSGCFPSPYPSSLSPPPFISLSWYHDHNTEASSTSFTFYYIFSYLQCHCIELKAHNRRASLILCFAHSWVYCNCITCRYIIEYTRTYTMK
jgi:hypothetical protein